MKHFPVLWTNRHARSALKHIEMKHEPMLQIPHIIYMKCMCVRSEKEVAIIKAWMSFNQIGKRISKANTNQRFKYFSECHVSTLRILYFHPFSVYFVHLLKLFMFLSREINQNEWNVTLKRFLVIREYTNRRGTLAKDISSSSKYIVVFTNNSLFCFLF